MPPQLALLLCTVFVLFLLFLERRGSRDVSAAMWIPTIWVLIAASRPLATWFIGSEQILGGNESGSPLDRWSLAALGAAAIIILTYRRFDWWSALRRHKWLVALLAYMFVSTFWSEITLIAMRRWMRELIVFFMALLLVSEASPRRALESLLRRCAYVLLPFSVVLIKYYPLLGRQYARYSGMEMWTGATGHKNELGRLCMITILFFLWSFYRRWRKSSTNGDYSHVWIWADISVIMIAVYLLFGANSSTSKATLVVGVTILLVLRLFRKLKFTLPQVGVLALVVFVIGFGALAPFLGGSNVAVFSSSLGRDSTLTGRTDVWAAVLPAMRQQPLFGHGFGSFWTDARRELYEIPTAHNGYLDVMLELGLVGLAFYTFWMISCARQFLRAFADDYGWASLGICFLFMNLTYNATESALNSLAEYMTAMLVLASAVVPAKIALKSDTLVSEMNLRAKFGKLSHGTDARFGNAK